MVSSSILCFQEYKPIATSLLPIKGKKWASYKESWAPTIRSHVLSGKKMKSNVDYRVGSGDELSSWLYYHIKEHTVPVIILGQSRFKTFLIKPFQATAQLGSIWYVLWPVCWNFAKVWNTQLRLEQHGALGAICNTMAPLNFHNQQKILYNNNIQYWNYSTYLNNWTRLSLWSGQWKATCKNSFCWRPNFLKLVFYCKGY